MSTSADLEPPVYVLTLEAVKWGIQNLQAQRIHQFFLAYLHLRQRSAEIGSTSGITPDWKQLGVHLRAG